MTEPLQNPPPPPSPFRKMAFTCGTFTLAASLTLSLATMVAAVLVLLGILP
jgi:hypothetical protein